MNSKEVVCSQRETLLRAMSGPCTGEDMQKRKGKIPSTKTKGKRKPASFPEAMNGYKEESV